MIDPEIALYYNRGDERERLTAGGDSLELVRTKELIERVLPAPPVEVLDVGGGTGVYAAWLARLGYRVQLIDPMPLHAEQAEAAAAAQPAHPFAASLGDARRLPVDATSVDAVLLLGPLYHLTERADRITALREAYRVLRPGGVLLAVGISRMASLLDALRQGLLHQPEAAAIVERDLRNGQHRNPDRHLGWFTTAYFHVPDELAVEVVAVGFEVESVLGIEGPGGYVGTGWGDPARRESILAAARAVEREPSIIGLSAHLLVVGHKPDLT
ncbi:MAG: class I SAM-dependent methyltransferase [Chloroflexota bacterium]|nr:class I SAM-dependent methyltransferase [Chloroflexota bacterium]